MIMEISISENWSMLRDLGGNWYAQITDENLFEVEKPNTSLWNWN